MNLTERIFTRKSANRHLMMLIPLGFVLLWTYVLIALLSNDWLWVKPNFAKEGFLNSFSLMTAMCGILTLLSVAIYWNARIWMVPFVASGFMHLIGAIPLVNLLIPADLRHSWFDNICDLASPDGDYVIKEYDEYGFLINVDDGSLPLLIAIPLGIIGSLLSGVFNFILLLLGGIGIPLLSPAILLILLQLVDNLLGISAAGGLCVGLVGLLATVFLFVVHPIVSYKID